MSVTVWSYDSGSPGSRISDWFANGISVKSNYTFDGNALPSANETYRFNFNTLSATNGQLLLSGRRNSSSAAATPAVFLNALQILQVSFGGLIASDIGTAMSNRNASVYVRIPFNVDDPMMIQSLKLRMKYDDGFVAYINGRVVASRNAPASPQWNSQATSANMNGTGSFEDFSLPVPPELLTTGVNMLCIHAMNVSSNDTDFLVLPELQGIRVVEHADRYFITATPGSDNETGLAGLVADTKFSVNRGFFDDPISLSITCATAGAEIRYTIDGSIPSPSNGFVFSTPIQITGQSFVRAAAFLPGYVPSGVDTHSYLFLRDVLRQSGNPSNYPTTWTQASYPADYAMDTNIVNHPVYGQTLSNDLRSIPSLCLVSGHDGLWNSSTGIYANPTMTGAAWERATSLELIQGDGKTGFATTCKVQVHGNASRDNARTPKHALGLSFNSDYGPTKLRYDWFGGGVAVHDKIVLRCCGFVDGWAGRYADEALYTSTETGETFRGQRYRPENTCYLRDSWMKDSFREMGWDASRSQYVHLYLNGLYWGLYEPSEHIDASYFALLHGGREMDWDVLVGEDNNGPPVIVDGTGLDWTNVLNIVNAGITNETAYQAVLDRVDIDNLIDYMIIHIVAEAEDWPRHNWYLAHRRATNGLPAPKFTCTVWDQDLILDRMVRRNRMDVGNTGGEVYGPARVYAQLRAWPEFRLRFADRVQKHLCNNGVLAPTNNIARMLASAALIRNAITAESARWGDARKFPTPGSTNGTGQTFTRDEWWQPEIDKLTTNFFYKLTDDNIARFRAGNLYPALGAPVFNQFGGNVNAGFALSISHTNPSGTVYFTVDGSDPRTYGAGVVAPGAQAFSTDVPLNSPTLVRARVLSAGQWSALVEAMFYPPQDTSKLVLTEIMYNPPAVGATNGDEFEFLELKNAGTNLLNLSGLTFTDGISFTFSNGTFLQPGAFFVLVRSLDAFASKYPGVPVGGVYSGKLDNGGEKIALSHPLGGTVFSVTYSDTAPWPATPDNHGFSLVQVSGGATQAPDDGTQWRASAYPGGSPSADDPLPTIPGVVINEVLTAPLAPGLDAIELYNPCSTNVDIGDWFLTDDPGLPQKFQIPSGTIIAAHGFVVFDETQFNATPGTNGCFALSARGDKIHLFSSDGGTNLTGYSHGFSFGASSPGVSFGRYINSIGEEQFPAQIETTFSNLNAGPLVGPVVIHEIHYHPEPGGIEFVELKNISAMPAAMFDENYPTNTWRLNGIGFVFPTNIIIDAGGMMLLVATNPADFRARYAVPSSVPVMGPYPGLLQGSGERLQLERPAVPASNGVDYIVVDEVRYHNKFPWPSSADGGGASLQRLVAAHYGNDPVNWLAATPTPGTTPDSIDSDNDGLPDAWELAHGLNPYDPTDGNIDSDHDGHTNLEEYRSGTDPQDASSVLKISPVIPELNTNGILNLVFEAMAGKTYTVELSLGLNPASWQTHMDLDSSPTNRSISLPIALDKTNAFYRIRSN